MICIYCKQTLQLPNPLDGYVLSIKPCPQSPWPDERHKVEEE